MESLQLPPSYEQPYATPGKNATRHEDLISEGATIDVSNIPVDMSAEVLQMIFENRRIGGGGEVKNIIYEKGQGSAVITLSDSEGTPFIPSFILSVTHSSTQSPILTWSRIHSELLIHAIKAFIWELVKKCMQRHKFVSCLRYLNRLLSCYHKNLSLLCAGSRVIKLIAICALLSKSFCEI